MQVISKEFMRFLLKRIMDLLFHVKVEGLEHYKKIKGPTIVIANHVFFLDGLLIAVYLPIDLVNDDGCGGFLCYCSDSKTDFINDYEI